mgnify:CR=1 FL=1
MENAVCKFELTETPLQPIIMPKGSIILSVQVQGNQPCLWAFVNTKELGHEVRNIAVVGTGHKLPEGIDPRYFLGTYQLHQGSFVGHVFEVK